MARSRWNWLAALSRTLNIKYPKAPPSKFTRRSSLHHRTGPVEALESRLVLTPTVTIFADDSMATEGTADDGMIRVSRNESTGPLTVTLTIGGTATTGTDYSSLPPMVSFAAGVNNVFLTVDALADSNNDPGEGVAVMLAPGAGYLVGAPSSAVVTINESGGGGGGPTLSIN